MVFNQNHKTIPDLRCLCKALWEKQKYKKRSSKCLQFGINLKGKTIIIQGRTYLTLQWINKKLSDNNKKKEILYCLGIKECFLEDGNWNQALKDKQDFKRQKQKRTGFSGWINPRRTPNRCEHAHWEEPHRIHTKRGAE